VTVAAAAVEKVRGGLTVAIDHLRLGAGSRTALVGPSGCGKSTALDLLAATLRPDRVEELTVADGDLAALWRAGASGALTAWRARRIGYVLQTGGLLGSLSVAENIRLSRRLLGLPGWGSATAVVERLGLSRLLQRRPAQLSIGERQRVAVARALAHDPAVVLADEPTAALDPALAEEVMTLLSELALEQGTTLLVVTHDAELAAGAGITIVRCEVRPGRTSIVAEVA